MTPRRPVLLLAPGLLLGLVACGGTDQEHARRERTPPPLGFELAMFGVAGAGAPETVDEDAAAALPAAAQAPAPLVPLNAEQLADRLAEGTVRLIDVRTDAEVAEGMIPGAEHIPLDRFDPAEIGSADGRDVVLYCRSGRRSAIAGERLAAVLGHPVEHLEGGIIAWEAAGKPLAESPAGP